LSSPGRTLMCGEEIFPNKKSWFVAVQINPRTRGVRGRAPTLFVAPSRFHSAPGPWASRCILRIGRMGVIA